MIGNVYLKKEGLSLENELRIIVGDASSDYGKPEQFYVLLVERLFNDYLHKVDQFRILADPINVRHKEYIESKYDFLKNIKEETLNKITEISVDIIRLHKDTNPFGGAESFDELRDQERKMILKLFKILKADPDFHFEFLLE